MYVCAPTCDGKCKNNKTYITQVSPANQNAERALDGHAVAPLNPVEVRVRRLVEGAHHVDAGRVGAVAVEKKRARKPAFRDADAEAKWARKRNTMASRTSGMIGWPAARA